MSRQLCVKSQSRDNHWWRPQCSPLEPDKSRSILTFGAGEEAIVGGAHGEHGFGVSLGHMSADERGATDAALVRSDDARLWPLLLLSHRGRGQTTEDVLITRRLPPVRGPGSRAASRPGGSPRCGRRRGGGGVRGSGKGTYSEGRDQGFRDYSFYWIGYNRRDGELFDEATGHMCKDEAT